MQDVAVVTGGWKGIGRVVAEGLAESGLDVAVFDVDRRVVDIRNSGGAVDGRLVGYLVDVSDPEAVDGAFASLQDRMGPVRFLVNNAGIYPRAALADISFQDWMRVLEVNVGGGFNCAKALVARLPAGARAAIVNVSSTIAFEGARKGSHYAASKAAVLGLTRALAVELAPDVRVNTVAPGVTDTDQVREGGRGSAELAAFALAEVPLRRLGEPTDVLQLVQFLLSDRASYLTGQTIHVNGGTYLW